MSTDEIVFADQQDLTMVSGHVSFRCDRSSGRARARKHDVKRHSIQIMDFNTQTSLVLFSITLTVFILSTYMMFNVISVLICSDIISVQIQHKTILEASVFFVFFVRI